MAFSDSFRDVIADAPDAWRTIVVRVRAADSERVNVAAVLADIPARDVGHGWAEFWVARVADEGPTVDFAASQLGRLDRAGCGGEVRLHEVVTGMTESRSVVGQLADGSPVYES